jgi:large subunit ribosomal protein L29
MADYLTAEGVRALSKDERAKRLKDLRQELMHQRGVAAMGGSPPSPGKIRQLRRQIARILTIEREQKLGLQRGKKTATAPRTAKPKTATKEA